MSSNLDTAPGASTNEEETVLDFTTLPEGAPAEPDWPLPKSLEFLRSLRPVNIKELPKDTDPCMICRISFFTPHPDEHPVRLPCPAGHLVGSRCISQWLSPLTGENNSSCPHCRTEIFEKEPRMPINTDAGLMRLMVMVDWATQLTPLKPEEEQMRKELWGKVLTHVDEEEEMGWMDQEVEDNMVYDGELPEIPESNDRFSRSFYLPCERDPEDEEYQGQGDEDEPDDMEVVSG